VDYRKTIFDWIVETRVKREGSERLVLALADGLSRMIALHFGLDRTRANAFMDACFGDIRANTMKHIDSFESVLSEIEKAERERTPTVTCMDDKGNEIETITAEEYLRHHFNPEKPNG